MNNPRSGFDKAGDPVLFHRPGTFPHISDPEYKVADEDAADVQDRRACRSRCARIAPAVHEAGFPYSVTAFIADHGAQTVLLLIPSLVILLPLLRIIPSVYSWSVRRRLLYWYRQLKALEKNLDGIRRSRASSPPIRPRSSASMPACGASAIRSISPTNSIICAVHIDLVRQRLFQKPHAVRIAAE